MNWTHDAPVFEELLKLNPWAEPLWPERNELVRSGLWNINYINQAGNPETKAWLERFFEARSEATLCLLRGSTSRFEEWATGIGLLARKLFADDAIIGATIGTPMQPTPDGGHLVNTDASINEYSTGQFKADFLLLSQSSLRGLEISESLDIFSKTFPIGLDLVSARFLNSLNAGSTKLGPYSDLSSATFKGKVDFSSAQFFDQAHFTVSGFSDASDFSGVVFHGPASFDATRFSGHVTFANSRFGYSAQFNGSLFAKTPDFSGAVFEGDTSFADSIFHNSASFSGTSFPGKVFVGRIPADVRQGILDAHHPE